MRRAQNVALGDGPSLQPELQCCERLSWQGHTPDATGGVNHKLSVEGIPLFAICPISDGSNDCLVNDLLMIR